MKTPRIVTVKWRHKRNSDYGDRETWFARYRGWTLYVGRVAHATPIGDVWRATLHRFTRDGMADMPACEQWYRSREGAQNAAEFYAEHNRFPHAQHAEAVVS